jgi:hypothetical protein
MGYLDNSSVTVDAILTNKGRQILAAGGQLNVVKFALSDDEIDYDLWNPAHTLGTNYYGAVIENMPILEGLPDETQMMRYKLLTLPKNIIGIPVISVNPSSVLFTGLNQSQVITPNTENLQGANTSLGYTAILSDDTVCELSTTPTGLIAAQEFRTTAAGTTSGAGAGNGITSAAIDAGSVTSFLDDEVTGMTTAGKTVTRTGTQFQLRPLPQSDTNTVRRALLTIIGNETGGFKTISITLNPNNFLQQNIQLGPLGQ